MQGTQGDAVDAGVQEMEDIGGMQGCRGCGRMPTCMGTLCQGAAESPFQGLGEQQGVCQVSSSGTLLTCAQCSPAHASPIPAPMPNSHGGQQRKGPLNITSP